MSDAYLTFTSVNPQNIETKEEQLTFSVTFGCLIVIILHENTTRNAILTKSQELFFYCRRHIGGDVSILLILKGLKLNIF